MRMLMRLAALVGSYLPILAAAFTPISLNFGWNLVGNSDTAPIAVPSQLNASQITTVWKWNKQTSRWAFYAPSMTATELNAYAQSKGYDVLGSIDANEGFWINANAQMTLSDASTSAPSPRTLLATDLIQGWNLMCSADNKTPSQLNTGLNANLAAASKAVSTVWAWDASNSKWKFYAPSLEIQGGTVLADYITNKGYLPFTNVLTATDGFWLNIATATPPVVANYFYLANDTLRFDNGFDAITNYTLAQFQSKPGIAVKWPIKDAAAIRFTLSEVGSFTVASGQTLSAALSIVDTAPGAQGLIKLYIDNINITQTGSNLTLSVPSSAVAWVYGVATDGSGAALQNFNSTVANATTTLGTANQTTSEIVLGSAINSAINSIGTNINMTGTYLVTLVVQGLPLSQSNGTAFTNYTVDVPKSLADMSIVHSVTGPGIQGYISLMPW